MRKNFKISATDIKPLIGSYGGCIASDKITVEGYPVRFMYREEPDGDADSGWRFMSAFEDDSYLDDANNFGYYNVNTIANYDPSIIPFLDEPAGSVFERTSKSERFLAVNGWVAPEA
jgi:hypothetical protein